MRKTDLDSSASRPADLVRVRLTISYDGTSFSGWARQPGLRTVQGTLEQAIAQVTRSEVQLTVAGRTDAGVHARGQVAHLDLPREVWEAMPGRSSRSPGNALVHRISGVVAANLRHSPGLVPGLADVVVHAAEEVSPDFDARFSAVWRRYTYRIADTWNGRDPLRRDVLWHGGELDVGAMDDAAGRLLGEHDFAAFCKPREGATTIRTLQEFSWQRVGELVEARVRADAFCHSMVRALVGASLAVGTGRKPVTWPAEVLAARLRDPGVAVAPAHGLTLEEVAYPPGDQLAERAAQARNVRTLGSAENPAESR